VVPLDKDVAAEVVSAWRSATPAVTAVCAYDDTIALAVLAGLRRHDLTAPHDMAVIGVNDLAAGRLSDPELTTVVVDQWAVAQHLAQTIAAGLGHRPAPRRPGSDIINLIICESA
jgi:DNA-binding LacI/PurR family transcriptional regulator